MFLNFVHFRLRKTEDRADITMAANHNDDDSSSDDEHAIAAIAHFLILRKQRIAAQAIIAIAATMLPPERPMFPVERLDLGKLSDADCLQMFR